ncbi:MAG: NBR1-Ig-like domain-containing protein [Anaerolineaceae bacterium]|nr:NBR1-Ig-like domain-containing protein [Anaerolineaceae bacterium]
MMRKTPITLTSIMITVLLAACGAGQGTPTSAVQEQVQTSVAQTVEVMSAQLADQQQPSATSYPTATLAPSGTPPAPATKAPAAAAPPVQLSNGASPNCDNVAFLGDITIPDDDIIPPGSTFKKTWALKNNGTCTWTTDYAMAFTSGDQMGANPITPLTAPVAPGQIVLVSIVMKAPERSKIYTGFYKMRNAGGTLFGWGTDSSRSVYVKIDVGDQYDFINNLCSASWRNSAGLLYCPSKQDDPQGFAVIIQSPMVENGLIDQGQALVMEPDQVTDGKITGRYNPIIVPGGHLRTIVGCMYGYKLCKVKMGITYSVDGGPDIPLDDSNEWYDGFTTKFDTDLAAMGLEGKSVAFTFYVYADHGPTGDEVFWLDPKISP